MITELTSETYFEQVKVEGPLHVVMHYGKTCGPCKITMPHYEIVMNHFLEYGITNVRFYLFHHWEQEYKPFIIEHKLTTIGVPEFKFFYMGELIEEKTRSYNDPNLLKQDIADTITAIISTMGGFDLYAS